MENSSISDSDDAPQNKTLHPDKLESYNPENILDDKKSFLTSCGPSVDLRSTSGESTAMRLPADSSQDVGIRRYRTAFSRDQVARLEREFLRENYVSRPRRNQLAIELGLPESTIKVWFQNRRMKDKRQRLALTWPYWDPTLAALMHRPFVPQLTPAGPPFLPSNPFFGLTSSILSPATAIEPHSIFPRSPSLYFHPPLPINPVTTSSVNKHLKTSHTCSSSNYLLPPHITPFSTISSSCIGCLQQAPPIQTIGNDFPVGPPTPSHSINIPTPSTLPFGVHFSLPNSSKASAVSETSTSLATNTRTSIFRTTSSGNASPTTTSTSISVKADDKDASSSGLLDKE